MAETLEASRLEVLVCVVACGERYGACVCGGEAPRPALTFMLLLLLLLLQAGDKGKKLTNKLKLLSLCDKLKLPRFV